MLLLFYVVLGILFESGATSRILGVFPSPGYSQFILAEKLMGELVRRGHDVTVIAPYQPKKAMKNYKTILANNCVKVTQDFNHLEMSDISIFPDIMNFYTFAVGNAKSLLVEDEVQNLIHSNETFDLIIVEQFGNEAHMGFASHFKAPLVSFSSIGLSEWNSGLVGSIRLPSVVPLLVTKFTNRMNFWQRAQNTIYYTFDYLYRYFIYFPKQEELLNQYFPGKHNLSGVMSKVELLLMNSHFTTTDPTLLTSAVVEIGGFHIKTNELHQDLKIFLDEAKHGAIFFSMGSINQSSKIPKEKINVILKVFSKLKQRVVWKFENKSLDYQHNNLYISKWLPQPDILAHSKVVAFITHSGLLSTTEAIYHGVPMIGIPIFSDQRMNVKRVVEKKFGIELPYLEITEESLEKALKDILENPVFRENAQKLSSIMKHQPIQPLDLAMYWLEHIIHYHGGHHLRNSSIDLYWFQLYLLDVVSFFVISLAVIIYSISFIVKSILCRRRNSNEKIKKN